MATAINWIGNYNTLEGYGLFSVKLLKAMLQLGTEITPVSFEQTEYFDTELLQAAGVDLTRLTVYVGIPAQFESNSWVSLPEIYNKFSGRLWLLSMIESTTIWETWVNAINTRYERVIVPHVWNKEVFESCGVDVPVHIVPGGIDPNQFYPSIVPHRPYTFMAFGDRGNRKGWGRVWAAFHDAFGDSKDVRLVVKTRSTGEAHNDITALIRDHLTDPRVTFLRGNLSDMRDVYIQADCFVFPSLGEGYGLPPREAAACGVPAIVTKYSGLDDETEKWAYSIGYKEVESSMPAGGKWAMPNHDELVERMRWCYDNQSEARSFALQASEWLRANRTWQHSAQALWRLIKNQDELIAKAFLS